MLHLSWIRFTLVDVVSELSRLEIEETMIISQMVEDWENNFWDENFYTSVICFRLVEQYESVVEVSCLLTKSQYEWIISDDYEST